MTDPMSPRSNKKPSIPLIITYNISEIVKYFVFSALLAFLNQFHGIHLPPSQLWYCWIQMFNLHVSTFCSNYLLITMMFERCYSIIRLHKASSFNTVKKARVTIACIFVGFTSYAVPILFIGGSHGNFSVSNPFASKTIMGKLYYQLTDITIFFVPFFSLLIMNSVIIHTLWRRSKQDILQSTGQGQIEGQVLKSKQSEKQIITMLLLITFVFLTLGVPTRARLLYLNLSRGNAPYYYAGLHLFYQVGEITYLANHGINFFLYVISGQKFRKDLKELFLSKKSGTNESFSSGTLATMPTTYISSDK